jgi:hypothetical protein
LILFFPPCCGEAAMLEKGMSDHRHQRMTVKALPGSQLEFNAGAGQMSELVRGGRDILNGIQAITANAQQLANDLAGFGRTPAAAAQSAETPAEATRKPAAVAKPADSTNPAQTIERR